MSLQKKIQKKKTAPNTTDDAVESFGVCSKSTTFNNEQRKFILHLRVHTNHNTPLHPAPAESTDTILSIVPDNETYNDLMRYNPTLSSAPVAYEQNSTDSCPLLLDKTTTRKENDIKQHSVDHLTPILHKESSVQSTDKDDFVTNFAEDMGANTSVDIENQKHCWWCTYSFKHEPFSMPLRLAANNQYDTVGCFCSPECTASYIFANKCGVCDPWKQYEMLHRMVNKQHNGVEIRIKLAPPRETLQRYGGPYDIETYRTILQDYRKLVRISMPPINPIQKMIEEVAVDYTKRQHKFLPIDSTRVKKAEKELCLKRKKKQSSENTLEAFMRLRTGKTN